MKPEASVGKQIVKIGFSPFMISATDSIIIIALNAVLQFCGGPENGDALVTAATIVQSYMFLISRIMPQYFVRIFTDNPEYGELAVWGIRTFALMIVPLSFQYVIVDGLTALGMTRIALTMSMIRKSLYFGLTCVLPMIFAAKNAFYAEPLADGTAAALSCVIFFFIYRKYLRGEGRLKDIKI